jgi:hypothetical protein
MDDTHLKLLYQQNKKSYKATDTFSTVLTILAGLGMITAIASLIYVENRLSIFTDASISGVLPLFSTPPSGFRLNVHYVCIPSADIFITLPDAGALSSETYLSLYQPWPLCGQSNSPTTYYTTITFPGLVPTVSLNYNMGILLKVVMDITTKRWKIIRTWEIDAGTDGVTSRVDCTSYILEGRKPSSTNWNNGNPNGNAQCDSLEGKGINQPY